MVFAEYALQDGSGRVLPRGDLRRDIVFLEDYETAAARYLVQGADVWLNTPRRPWEASGTSGMKVLVNGGINLSELDGWWAEAYRPEVGWAVGDRLEHGNIVEHDARDAEELYRLLEQEVIPLFYQRDEKGIPRQWLQRVRRAMVTLVPQYTTRRMVRQYTEKYYLAS